MLIPRQIRGEQDAVPNTLYTVGGPAHSESPVTEFPPQTVYLTATDETILRQPL